MVFPELAGSVDHKVSPSCPTLLGCVYEGDVWVLDAKTGKKHQLTATAGEHLPYRGKFLHGADFRSFHG